jgi:hypothetical protein
MLRLRREITRKPTVGATRILKKLGPALFLLWLLLVNVFYYAQFRELALSRLPWLARLWR